MIRPRNISATIERCLKQFPAIMLTGARQSGKTTLVRYLLKDAAYLSFDDPLNRDFARQDPNGFLDQFRREHIILDEIQYVPEILPYIKMRIDAQRRVGQWVLTGSQPFHLMKEVSETLAGRIAVLDLAPFSLSEVEINAESPLKEILWRGLFPDPYLHADLRDIWVRSYLQTYLERDVRQLGNIQNLRAFELFVRLSAAFHGQEFHPARLARECGVSQPTISSWSRTLIASYLGLELPPFYRNYGKRLIKTPKFYYADSALVCQMTRQPSPDAALSGNMAGALFEGLIVTEAQKAFLERGMTPNMYFWRSNDGVEVDLILELQGVLWPVEIKLTATPTTRHFNPIEQFKKTAAEDDLGHGLLVCRTTTRRVLPNGHVALPWFAFPAWLRRRMDGVEEAETE